MVLGSYGPYDDPVRAPKCSTWVAGTPRRLLKTQIHRKAKTKFNYANCNWDHFLHTYTVGARGGIPLLLGRVYKGNKNHKSVVMGIRGTGDSLVGFSLGDFPLCWYHSQTAGLQSRELPLCWQPPWVPLQKELALSLQCQLICGTHRHTHINILMKSARSMWIT